MQVASNGETYEGKGAKQVRIIAPRDSDEKRFCTFHGFFSATGMFIAVSMCKDRLCAVFPFFTVVCLGLFRLTPIPFCTQERF